MKKLIHSIFCALAVILILANPARAQMVTESEALNVARNWVTLIIHLKGNWGGSETADITSIQEFRKGTRVVGYVCSVNPQGYIVIPLRKELAPVKMYSAKNNLAVDLEEGMPGLIKEAMGRTIDGIERKLGPLSSITRQSMQSVIEIDHNPLWAKLSRDTISFSEELYVEGGIAANYQASDTLLTSSWHQGDPYYLQCPAPQSGDTCTAPHCPVGCGPLADSQIMRYWAWPPYGEGSPYNDTYDWVNMADTLTINSPTVQINAVAEISREVGIASSADYCQHGGCETGNTLLQNMDAFMDHFRYSQLLIREERRLYPTDSAWYNAIKAQLNMNRPVLYEIPQHFIVMDGWQEIGTEQELHVVYGHGGSNDGWYTLDYEIPRADVNWPWEKMVPNIVPEPAIGTTMSGTYSRDSSFPYRYFDQDCTGTSAIFNAGQSLQFLPTISARATSSTGGVIRFLGSNSYSTSLFSIRGTTTTASVAGARIYNGGIRLHRYGGIKFH